MSAPLGSLWAAAEEPRPSLTPAPAAPQPPASASPARGRLGFGSLCAGSRGSCKEEHYWRFWRQREASSLAGARGPAWSSWHQCSPHHHGVRVGRGVGWTGSLPLVAVPCVGSWCCSCLSIPSPSSHAGPPPGTPPACVGIPHALPTLGAPFCSHVPPRTRAPHLHPLLCLPRTSRTAG